MMSKGGGVYTKKIIIPGEGAFDLGHDYVNHIVKSLIYLKIFIRLSLHNFIPPPIVLPLQLPFTKSPGINWQSSS